MMLPNSRHQTLGCEFKGENTSQEIGGRCDAYVGDVHV